MYSYFTLYEDSVLLFQDYLVVDFPTFFFVFLFSILVHTCDDSSLCCTVQCILINNCPTSLYILGTFHPDCPVLIPVLVCFRSSFFTCRFVVFIIPFHGPTMTATGSWPRSLISSRIFCPSAAAASCLKAKWYSYICNQRILLKIRKEDNMSFS